MKVTIRRAGEIFRVPKNLLDANWLTILPRKGKVHSILDRHNLHAGFIVRAAHFWTPGWVGSTGRREEEGHLHFPRESSIVNG